MTTLLTTVFVIVLAMNTMLVLFDIDNGDYAPNAQIQLYNISEDNKILGIKDTALQSISPQNLTTSSVNTGDPSNTDFKIIDSLRAFRTFLGILIRISVAPISMALNYDFPPVITWLILAPLNFLFFLSLALIIRGISA